MDYRQIEGAPNYRMDHVDVGEVKRTSFTYGTIKEFGFSSLNPITPDHTCTVQLDAGGIAEGVPIFYHCKRNFHIDDDLSLLEIGALKHGVMAFEPEKRVKVMVQNNHPVAVIGHGDHKPKACANNFKVVWKEWTPTYHTDIYDWQKGQKISDTGNLRLTKEAVRIRGSRELVFGTTGFYYGDWMFRIGPILCIFSISSVLMPGPLTISAVLRAAPFTQELWDSTIEEGERRDKSSEVWLFWFNPLTTVEWPGFTQQAVWSSYLTKIYQSSSVWSPRWLYAKLYYQDVFEVFEEQV